MTDITGLCVFCGVPIAGLLFYLSYVLFARLQARTLEYLATLVVASFPIGLFSRLAQETNEQEKTPAFVVMGVLLALLPFGGSIWGLSCAKRLDETRAWPRFGLIALGWFAGPGLLALLIGCVWTLGMLTQPLPIDRGVVWLYLGTWLCTTPVFFAWRVEGRCRARQKQRSNG